MIEIRQKVIVYKANNLLASVAIGCKWNVND